jgi:threonine dehydrogenase-like Zn-dependent dehydrogenase
MASAPRGQHELDFEAEEAAILTAVGQTRIDLMVEDTGDPEHLGRRLAGTQAEKIIGAETINYETDTVAAELRERTGGRGPDICIEAVGMEADSPGPQYLYDQVKQQLRLETDRAIAIRQAIHACRKGGGVFALGVCAGLVDKFPLGAVMNKSLTLRGAQQHGHRYIPEILDLMARGEVKASHLATHVMPLTEGPTGYRMFKNKENGCVRAVFQPAGG